MKTLNQHDFGGVQGGKSPPYHSIHNEFFEGVEFPQVQQWHQQWNENPGIDNQQPNQDNELDYMAQSQKMLQPMQEPLAAPFPPDNL